MPRDALTVEELEHHALRNAIYHTARRHFLEKVGKWLTLFTIIAGAGTVASVLPQELKTVLGLVVTVAGSLQLVFDFSGRARDHGLLQRRFYELNAKIQEGGDLDGAARLKLMAELMRIAGDEPPTMRALDAIAYNQATDALYGDDRPDPRLYVSWWQSLTSNIWPYNAATFEPPEQRDNKVGTHKIG